MKEIPGYDGRYKITEDGKVWSIPRRGNWEGRFLSQHITYDGYAATTLYSGLGPKQIKIHRLVALTYIPNPKNKPQINHIDGDKINNNYSNLEWCTHTENQRHAWSIGLKKQKKGIESPFNIPVKQYTIEGVFIRSWYSMKQVHDVLGFFPNHIGAVCKGKLKTAYGYKWGYEK